MTQAAEESHAIVADVGGTNTRVALAEGPRIVAGSVRRFRNAQARGLDEILRAYLVEMTPDRPCRGACVAVAGPVRDGRARLTNLDWSIDEGLVSAATGADAVAVVNDLQAQGHAIGYLETSSTLPVIEGPDAGPQATKLVVGVGTGFNAAPVFEAKAGRHVPPSESGHAALPIRSEEELRLAHFVEGAANFASVEDVLSGRGVEHVYAWHAEAAGTRERLTAGEILQRCRSGGDDLADATVRTFVRVLGGVAGNLALTFLPFGGIYLVGGVARAFHPHLQPMGFAEAFRDKGRFAAFMTSFPVRIVDDDYAALVGCASHLSGLLDQR